MKTKPKQIETETSEAELIHLLQIKTRTKHFIKSFHGPYLQVNKVLADRLAYTFWLTNKRHLKIEEVLGGVLYKLYDGERLIFVVSRGKQVQRDGSTNE